MNNYVVSAHKASTVAHTEVGEFFGRNERNLLVNRRSRIDVYNFTQEGLMQVLEIPIYGRIMAMKLCRVPGDEQQQLLVLTERKKFCVLRWNAANGECDTIAGGDVQDKIGRAGVVENIIGIVDPDFRCFGLHLYEGVLKIVPTDYKKNSYSIRVGQQIQDVVFLHGCERPTIAVMHADSDCCVVRAVEIPQDLLELDTQEVWEEFLSDCNGTKLIAVPKPACGVILVSDQMIMYIPMKQGERRRKIPNLPTIFEAAGMIDDDGSRFLLGDSNGVLWLLALKVEGTDVMDLDLQRLGVTSVATSISYLDNGVIFIGSHGGDSQLVKLMSESDPETGMNISILDSYPNLGPIVDFCVVQERQKNLQIVTCSGTNKDGSLRVIRNGISFTEQVSAEQPGIRNMFALKRDLSDDYHSFLVQSYTAETRILLLGEEMGETEIESLNTDRATLYAGNVGRSCIVQVVSSEIRLLNCGSFTGADQWTPPSGQSISLATGNLHQLMVAMSGGQLAVFQVDSSNNKLLPKAHTTFPSEVSCIDCSPLGSSSEGRAEIAAVGTWKDLMVRLISMDDLSVLHAIPLDGETIARSTLLVTMDALDILMVSLGDGHINTYRIDRSRRGEGMVAEIRRLGVCTQAATLKVFRSNGHNMVFAACAPPTVIYSRDNGEKLLTSMVNMQEVTCVCTFDLEGLPGRLAIATEDTLTIGTVDSVHKLHIRAIPLGEDVIRIAHHASQNVYGIICRQQLDYDQYSDKSVEADSKFFVRLLDASFQPLDSFGLHTYEIARNLVSMSFGDDPMAEDTEEYIVVGTGYERPDEQFTRRPGRILVFSVAMSKLTLVAVAKLNDQVHKLLPKDGALLAGVNTRVELFRLRSTDDGHKVLNSECAHHGHSLVLDMDARNEHILVGDLMMSMSLLEYSPTSKPPQMKGLAMDAAQNWMTAAAILDDDTFIGAETYYNLFTLKYNASASDEDERHRLEVVGEFHLGDCVNKIQTGSLVTNVAETTNFVKRTLIFCTPSGVLGIIAQLSSEQYKLLADVQQAMTQVVRGVGGFSHDEWRKFMSADHTSEARNFLDGDLIERFLDLKSEQKEKVARLADTTVRDLTKQIDDLQRLH